MNSFSVEEDDYDTIRNTDRVYPGRQYGEAKVLPGNY